jgi:transcriptional regulator with PAS, ATPase and Fis domain
MMDIQSIKLRFGIIGNSPLLDRAIDIARQVAPTDISVLITGESGTGKEFFPKIIHQLSVRKHGPYIAVNCGAIPEGTIDSELFGHEKGSFTGAHETRKGYFEVVEGGTIFLDEVAELPLSTQVRLLRVLESGEFMKVGSSKVQKANVRVVAATNVDIPDAINKGKFREDLYYRLNTVPIRIPALRDRKDDIELLFRKFAVDFAEKYRMPALQLTDDARQLLAKYSWKGNIRQLKNITEQISIIENERTITLETLQRYLPDTYVRELPVLYDKNLSENQSMSEREILYKILFDMRKDISDLKKALAEVIHTGTTTSDIIQPSVTSTALSPLYPEFNPMAEKAAFKIHAPEHVADQEEDESFSDSEVVDDILSLEKREKEIIQKALEKHKGRRKNAALELGISERTLYRKIKEYEIEINL